MKFNFKFHDIICFYKSFMTVLHNKNLHEKIKSKISDTKRNSQKNIYFTMVDES